MKAIALIRNGNAVTAFETKEVSKPQPQKNEVLIKVAAFGLNFADVMARKGMYKDAPPLPAILGYDVAGIVVATGENVSDYKVGDRVTALTRFGGYAEYAVANENAVAILPAELDFATSTALTTQYCTAYYAGAEMINLHKGDRVLIHAGAGGVGTALIQLALHKGCEIFATAGSEEKLAYLNKQGVHHPINYRKDDFEKVIKKITGNNGMDVIFDPVGGSSVKKGFRLLSAGGRLVCYGASDMTQRNFFGKIKSAIGFGIYHPAMLMMPSKSIIGVNMLKVADQKIPVIKRCLQQVMELTKQGVFSPVLGKVFNAQDIAAAHEYLEHRKSIGKIAVQWAHDTNATASN